MHSQSRYFSFLLENPLTLEARDVRFHSCHPTQDGHGWTCLLESDSLIKTLHEKERDLQATFQDLPDTSLFQNKNIPDDQYLPDLIKYRKDATPHELRQHWQRGYSNLLVKVTFTDPIGLGMGNPIVHQKRIFKVNLTIKGIWVKDSYFGPLIQMTQISQMV